MVDEGLKTSDDVRKADLDHIIEAVADELGAMAGHSVLITGGAGFLGFYLVQALLHWNDANPELKIDLVVIDNFARGVPEWLGLLKGRSDVRLVQRDITERLPEDFEDFDYVIHAAGIASPAVYRAHPIRTMDANVNGLRLLLDRANEQAAIGRPIKGFLYFSSSEIYGDPSPDAIPTPETYRGLVSSTGPRACYDESKRYGETLCVSFARQHGVPTRIVRPFNNYGPGMNINDGRVPADFSKAVIEDRDIVMYSDGSPTRTFCYVADAIVGYFKALVRGRDGEPYNIGVEEPEISMSDFGELVASIGGDLFDYRGVVVKQDSPEDDYLVDNPARRCPRIEKARTELGYQPQFSLEEGVSRTLLWYSQHRAERA